MIVWWRREHIQVRLLASGVAQESRPELTESRREPGLVLGEASAVHEVVDIDAHRSAADISQHAVGVDAYVDTRCLGTYGGQKGSCGHNGQRYACKQVIHIR